MSALNLSKNGVSLHWALEEGETEIEDSLNHTLMESYLEKLLSELTSFFWGEHRDGGLGILTENRTVEFHVELCRNENIRQYNAHYRDKDMATDVLSFPVFENLRARASDDLPPGELSLGDILIGYERACEQAREFGVTLEEELLHLVIHGLLHLCGYDHEISLEEEKLMESLEKRFVAAVSETSK